MTQKPPFYDQLRLPVVAAPMFLISGPALVIACCTQGVVGTFPALNQRTTEGFEAWVVEIKRGTMPKLGRGFFEACQDVGAVRRFVLCNTTEHLVLARDTEQIGLLDFIGLLKTL